MNRDDFMEFFRDDEKLNTLSTDDRVEVFSSIMPGGSCFTKRLLDRILSDYGVGNLKIVDTRPFMVGDRVVWKKGYEQLLATVEYAHKTEGTCSVQVRTDCGKVGAFYPDGRYLNEDTEPSLFHE